MSPGQPQFTRLGITGTMTPDLLTLGFEYQSGGWYGILLLYLPPSYDLALTRSGTQAYGDINLSHTEVGDFTDTHDLTGASTWAATSADLAAVIASSEPRRSGQVPPSDRQKPTTVATPASSPPRS